MEYVAVTLQLTLAFVCLAAAAGKLRGFPAFVTSVEQVARSVPAIKAPALFARRWAAPTVAAELAVAALLPWPRTAPVGAVLAVGVFGALTAAVAVAAARGTAAPCACFGRIARRLGPVHVARNAALTGVALLAYGTTALTAGAAPIPAGGAVACAVAAAAAAQLFIHWDGAHWDGARAHWDGSRWDGAATAGSAGPMMPVLPAPGTAVPADLAARTTGGSPLSAEDFAGEDVAIAFVTSSCTSCREALPRLREALAALPAGGRRPVVVLAGSTADWPEYLAALSPVARVVESGDDVPKGRSVADLFGVRTYPAVLVAGGGVVRRSGNDPADVLPAIARSAAAGPANRSPAPGAG